MSQNPPSKRSVVLSKHVTGMFLIFGACVVIAILVINCLWMVGKSSKKVMPLPNPVTLPPSTLESPQPMPPTSYEPVVDETVFATSSLLSPVDNRKMTLQIDWQMPREVSLSAALPYLKQQNPPVSLVKEDEDVKLMYRGVVASGEFKGSKLYFYSFCQEGMGCTDIPGYMLVDEVGKKAYVPGQKSFVPDGCLGYPGACTWNVGEGVYFSLESFVDFVPYFTALPNVSWESPFVRRAALTLQNGQVVRATEHSSFWNTVYYACNDSGCVDPNYVRAASSKDGVILWSSKTNGNTGCLYAFGKDGARYTYVTELSEAELKEITWKKGYVNTTVYHSFLSTGCGSSGCTDAYTAEEINWNEKDFTVVGTTSAGQSVYMPSSKDDVKMQQVYDTSYSVDASGQKISYEAFLQKYEVPVFYWKDALGRYVRYTPTDAVYPAECGKPVIYLYPEKTTNVSVKLGSNIHVTVSEPTYPSYGWDVVAQPNGQLTYKGQTYGSLFWEGTGVGYDVPKTGFLLKDGSVDEQLKTILAKYGLNDQESKEFREFWVPNMTGAPYYKVSFVETAAWNKAAPLHVSPRPTSVLRIFMDWQKLSKPVDVVEPTIQPFARDGFTLVEWGGLLRK